MRKIKFIFFSCLICLLFFLPLKTFIPLFSTIPTSLSTDDQSKKPTTSQSNPDISDNFFSLPNSEKSSSSKQSTDSASSSKQSTDSASASSSKQPTKFWKEIDLSKKKIKFITRRKDDLASIKIIEPQLKSQELLKKHYSESLQRHIAVLFSESNNIPIKVDQQKATLLFERYNFFLQKYEDRDSFFLLSMHGFNSSSITRWYNWYKFYQEKINDLGNKYISFFKILELRDQQKNKVGHFLFRFRIPREQKPTERLKVVLDVAFRELENKHFIENQAKEYRKDFVFFLSKKIEIKSPQIVKSELWTEIKKFNHFNYFYQLLDYSRKTSNYSHYSFFLLALMRKAFTENFVKSLKDKDFFPLITETFKLLEGKVLNQVLKTVKNYFLDTENNYWNSYSWKRNWERNIEENIAFLRTENEWIDQKLSDFNFGIDQLKEDNDFVFSKAELTFRIEDVLNNPFKQPMFSDLYRFLFHEKILNPQEYLLRFQKYFKNIFFVVENPVMQKTKRKLIENNFDFATYPDRQKHLLTFLEEEIFAKFPFLSQLNTEVYDVGFFKSNQKIFYCFYSDDQQKNEQFQFCQKRNKKYIYLKKFVTKLTNLKKTLKSKVLEERQDFFFLLQEWKLEEVEFLLWLLTNFETKGRNFLFAKFINLFFWIKTSLKNQLFFTEEKRTFPKHLLEEKFLFKNKPIVEDDLKVNDYSHSFIDHFAVAAENEESRVVVPSKKVIFPFGFNSYSEYWKKEHPSLWAKLYEAFATDNFSEFSLFQKNQTTTKRCSRKSFQGTFSYLQCNKKNLLANYLFWKQSFFYPTQKKISEKILVKFEYKNNDDKNQKWKNIWKLTKKEFLLSIVNKKFNFLLNESELTILELFSQSRATLSTFLAELKKFLLEKTSQFSSSPALGINFWQFLFPRIDGTFWNKFIEEKWERLFSETDFDTQKKNLKYLLKLLLWAETPFLFLLEKESYKKIITQNRDRYENYRKKFWQKIKISESKLLSTPSPKELVLEIIAKLSQASMADKLDFDKEILLLDKEITDFLWEKVAYQQNSQINKTIDSLLQDLEKKSIPSNKWREKSFTILLALKKNNIWKLPVAGEELNIYHLYNDYFSWDDIFEKTHRNKFGNNVIRSVLQKIENNKKSFLENAQYFLALRFYWLWNNFYEKLFWDFLLNQIDEPDSASAADYFKVDEQPSAINFFPNYHWQSKNPISSQFYNVYNDQFWKEEYKHNVQILDAFNQWNRENAFSLKEEDLNFLQNVSCFLLKSEYNPQLDKIFPEDSLAIHRRLQKMDLKNFLNQLQLTKKSRCELNNRIKLQLLAAVSNFSVWDNKDYLFKKIIFYQNDFLVLTNKEAELLSFMQNRFFFLKKTRAEFYQNYPDFISLLKAEIVKPIVAKINAFFVSDGWKNFLQRITLFRIPQNYIFFKNKTQQKQITTIIKLVKNTIAFLTRHNLEAVLLTENFQLDTLTEQQQNQLLQFLSKTKEIKKLVNLLLSKNNENNIRTPKQLMLQLQNQYFQNHIVKKFLSYHSLLIKIYLLGKSEITIKDKNKNEVKIDISNIYFFKEKTDFLIDNLSNSQIENIIKILEFDLKTFHEQHLDNLLQRKFAPIWKIIYQYLNIPDFVKKIEQLCINFVNLDLEKPLIFTKKQLNSPVCLREQKQNPLVDLSLLAKEKNIQKVENLSIASLEEMAKISQLKPKQISNILYFFLSEKTITNPSPSFSHFLIFIFSALALFFLLPIFLFTLKKIYEKRKKKTKIEKIFFL